MMIPKNKKLAYGYLVFALSFYLGAQIFQQYVLLIGPLADVQGLHASLLASQHPLNAARHILVYTSMFLMLPAFVILCRHYLLTHKYFSHLAAIFFVTFCLIEIGYRSVYLVQVLYGRASDYPVANEADRLVLLADIQQYFEAIEMTYLPLLGALFLGSFFLFLVSKTAKTHLVTVAMSISMLQQATRLAGYTPLNWLNIFTGFWYFIPVALSFSLLIASAWNFRRKV